MPPKILSTSLTSLSSIIFSVMDTDSLVSLALETCATILQNLDAILTQDINVHFRILFIAKFELFKLHSKVRSFKQMFEFNQVHLDPSTMYIGGVGDIGPLLKNLV